MSSGRRFKGREPGTGFSSSPEIEGPGSCVPLNISSKCCDRITFPVLHTHTIRQRGGKALHPVSENASHVAARRVLSFSMDLAVSVSALNWGCGTHLEAHTELSAVPEKKGGRGE